MVISFFIWQLPVFALVSALLYFLGYRIFGARKGRRPFLRHAVLWVFVCYILSLVYLTLLWYWPYITFNPGYYLLNLTPFVWLKETYIMGPEKMVQQLVLNIGMFLPMGLLAPMAFPRLRGFFKTAVTALCATLFIETVQYFMGRSADIDDVIMNLAGGVLGYLLFALCSRLFGERAWWRNALGLSAHDGE